ncbi:MAG: NTP transferase domain-containing protein [Gammaproteobacteria bacterium]
MTARHGIVLLAAGLSTRFEAGDKLLHPWRGQPLLAWAAARVRAADVPVRVAVIGPREEAKRAILAAAEIPVVVNPAPADGMGTSLAVGTRALPEDVAGVFVVLGDMPALPAEIFTQLADALRAQPDRTIAAPVHGGQRGHPVLFAACHLPALRALTGDEGARAILQAHAAQVCRVPCADPGVLRDLDTVAAFAE